MFNHCGSIGCHRISHCVHRQNRGEHSGHADPGHCESKIVDNGVDL